MKFGPDLPPLPEMAPARRVGVPDGPLTQAPDPVPDRKPEGTWKTVLGWAVGIGVVLLAVFAAVSVPPYGDLGPPPGSGGSTA